jgi:sec-independent protein translocase protein TatC
MTPPGPDAPQPPDAKPFLDHLEDLRRTLIYCAGALVVGMLVAAPLAPKLLALLKAPLRYVTDNPDVFLRSLEVGGAFSVGMRIAFWAGLLFSAPFILVFVARFIFPGLTEREKRAVTSASGFAVLLFVFGVFLGYKLTLPAALSIMFSMHGWLGIRAEWTVTSYVAFASQLLIAFGLVFELPTILLVLGKLGIISSDQLRHYRRHFVIVALIISAILTPPDVFSQLLMAIPLLLLYELCIWLVRATERKNAAAQRTEAG